MLSVSGTVSKAMIDHIMLLDQEIKAKSCLNEQARRSRASMRSAALATSCG